MTAMSNLEASTSSSGRADASRTAYCPDVVSLDDPNELIFDFMNPTFLRALYSCPTKGAVEWKNGARLTSLAYDYYGSETPWQMILAYNGFVLETHIPPGATINIPDISGLKSKLSVSNRGTVTRI